VPLAPRILTYRARKPYKVSLAGSGFSGSGRCQRRVHEHPPCTLKPEGKADRLRKLNRVLPNAPDHLSTGLFWWDPAVSASMPPALLWVLRWMAETLSISLGSSTAPGGYGRGMRPLRRDMVRGKALYRQDRIVDVNRLTSFPCGAILLAEIQRYFICL
jgi:hypothetical protein